MPSQVSLPADLAYIFFEPILIQLCFALHLHIKVNEIRGVHANNLVYSILLFKV
jgi:hypothetical protein